MKGEVKSKSQKITRDDETGALRYSKKYFDLSYRVFSGILKKTSNDFLMRIQSDLDKAEMDVSSSPYFAGVIFSTLLGGILFSVIFLVGLMEIIPFLFSAILGLFIPVSVIIIISIGLIYPRYKSSIRRKKIDENLGSALAFISAMSSADVPISVIMLKLSRMEEYGEIQKEAMKIARNTELLGMDIFTAMREVARTSPSPEWQKFLQGAVAISTAGARLKPYFVSKATEYQSKLRISLRRNAESVSIFAETYVVVGVAFPLFLIVILSVMGVITRSSIRSTFSFLVLFSFLVMPVVILAFILLISSVNKEVKIS